jgi:hypothetical protein
MPFISRNASDPGDCSGTIECRLPRGKDSSTSQLGQYWDDLNRSSGFLPSFIITETHKGSQREIFPIPRAKVKNMAKNGEFRLDLDVLVSSKRAKTEISLMLRPEQTKDGVFPISGFPRRLQDDYEGRASNSPINTYIPAQAPSMCFQLTRLHLKDLDEEKAPGIVRYIKRILLDYIPVPSRLFNWKLLAGYS